MTSRDGRATEITRGSLIGSGEYVIFEKMRWSTPTDVVAKIAAEMQISGFDLDAAAEDHTARAPRWYTAAEDMLTRTWTEGGWRQDPARVAGLFHVPVRNVWLNPPWGAAGLSKKMHEAAAWLGRSEIAPFPGTERFVAHAWSQSRLGLTVACLLPQALDTKWQQRMVRLADEIWIGDRCCFIDTSGTVGEAPPGGHCLLIFRPHVPPSGWPGGPRTRWDWIW